MVTQFPLDPMHLVDLRVVKENLGIIIWRPCVTEAAVDEIDIRFQSFVKFTPCVSPEIPVNLMSTSDLKPLNAAKYRNSSIKRIFE